MCRGLPLEVLGGIKAKPAAQQDAVDARPSQYDDIFLQYTYKVVPCDKNYRHDYATCPYSHLGESSERRHPSAYLPFMCGSTQHSTDLKEKCPFGTACKYAHGHFELWLHPGRFRTKMCSLGENCKRPVCFFAHSEQQLRVTPYSKLDTGAAAAAQQLAGMQQEAVEGGSACSSVSSDACTTTTSTHFTNFWGSDAAPSVESGGSPCSSVAPVDDLTCLIAGMRLRGHTAVGDMHLHNVLPGLAPADASSPTLEVAVAGAAATALSNNMWLAGNTGMLQEQLPLVGCNNMVNPSGFSTQQQLMLDMNSQLGNYSAAVPQQQVTGEMWMLPNVSAAAPAVSSLAHLQYAAGGNLAGLGPVQCQTAAGMFPGPQVDQWLAMGVPGVPTTLARCGIGYSAGHQHMYPAFSGNMLQQQHQSVTSLLQQQEQPCSNISMLQLLPSLPDQALQQLVGLLAVEPQA